MRILKWIGIGFGVIVLVTAALLFWLLRTESGARFALARATAAAEGKVSFEKSSGHLAGPLTLVNVRYRDPAAGVDARVGTIVVDVAILELFAKRVHVVGLDIGDLNVALTTVPPKPEEPASEFSLVAPIDVALDRLALKKAAVSQDGKPLFAADTLDLGAAWTRGGAVIKSLALRSPDGRVDLHGTLSSAPGYPGDGETTFQWKAADREIAGTLKARGDGRQATLELTLSAPTPATVTATLTQSRDFPWTAKVSVPRFDPKEVQPDVSLTAVALSIEGSGDKQHGALNGEVVVNDHRVQLEPFRYALDGETLKIEALTLRTPEAAGTLQASGSVELGAKPVGATLVVSWDGVELPPDLVGQPLATHGKLNASGSAEKFHADGALSVGPPGKLSDLALDLDGTPDAIALKQLALKQAKGGLDAQGTIKLKPAIGWQLTTRAKQLDPGAFAAEWPGALDFELATDGTMTDKGPDATIKLDKLGGTLRKRPVSGSADLKVKPGYVIDGTLSLASGKSRIDVAGTRGTEQTDATIKLAIASLADWVPDANGSLDGNFHVQGHWPKLAVNGTAHGAGIASGGTSIGVVDVTANIAELQPPNGTLTLRAQKVVAGNLAFETLDIDGGGSQKAHQLKLVANGTPLTTTVALNGSSADNGNWNGTLSTLDVAVKDVPKLALEAPAQFAWNGKQFSATDVCLAGGGPKLCVAGNGGSDGAFAARYRIEQLPLALLVKLSTPDAPLRVEGVLGGHGDVRRDAAGAFNGQATIGSDKGSIAYPDNATQPLLAYTGLALDANLAPQSVHATVRAALDHDGRIDGDLTLSGPMRANPAMSGKLDATLNSLAFVELLTPSVANMKGRVEAHYTFSGTTAAPALAGSLSLKEFATEVPDAGLKLHDGEINVRAADPEHFALDGTLKSGDGTLTLSGSGGIGKTAPAKATIKGDKFLAADIPGAKVVISPDLNIERSAENIRVDGSVAIPGANIDLAKLPGGGVNKASPDVVVTDAEQPESGKPLPLIVAVKVKLGDDVKLAGFGLDGAIGGELAVDQRPGRLATGTGTLNVSGTYKAYGQDLKIETGRLLFAGTSLDNPGLDISAVRTIVGASGEELGDVIKAGLQVRGTALVPVLTVFSTPAMEQSEALSYLITGKPLSGLKSGEGDMLGSAARALGSASGDLLAKGIGARTGMDVGVSDSSALGGSAFTVGKYLSPKLYLSYGVGLFVPGEVVTLKYLFTKRWNFEAQNASTGNRAGVNYRWEK
ncbi:MAG TPA: translocation/assembly module TamB domain-containing protein [Rhodanobacteraceae bacterium]|nr:translocation/assembly module TamB domain-containing protein [Rhodanobacteraceae bacterium]